MKKKFNPGDWLPTEKAGTAGPSNFSLSSGLSGDSLRMVEKAIEALEAANTDITTTYASWLEVGFALAQLGESGREYFHRVSRLHPAYDHKDCDEQFGKCLASKGSGITLGTFFYHVKEAGITLAPDSPLEEFPGLSFVDYHKEEQEDEKMPVLPESLYQELPLFLRKATALGSSPEEKDILLLGSLVTLSSCLTNFFGIYDGREVRPNLYLFITAPASAGKGRLSLCKRLVLPIHRAKRERAKMLRQQYEMEQAAQNSAKGEAGEKPAKPPERMLFLPANSSTTGLFQLLADNDGKGLIFETEGDTMSQVFKNDYGNYSDGFRKAFHHETISYYRRTDREYVDIEVPCLSTLLSGTPKQVTTLIPSVENGLFSRFLFYSMNFEPVWKKVFERNHTTGHGDYYDSLGVEFQGFYNHLKELQPIEITLSQNQIDYFDTYFSHTQKRYFGLFKGDYLATVRRMGLICFRLAMIFTSLRIMETGKMTKVMTCSDKDFQNIMTMVSILIRHSTRIFYNLPIEKKMEFRNDLQEKFLDALPPDFDRQTYLAIAVKLRIPAKTADKYVYRFLKAKLITRDQHNKYVFVPEEN